jgi:hypothetical protein
LIQRYIALTFIAALALPMAASANDERSLLSVAAADGYTYAWLPTEAGVVLTLPGVRVVLRSGRLFYEVNNQTPIADRAPIDNGDDLLISPALAAHLDEIAQRNASMNGTGSALRPNRLSNERVYSGPPRPVTIAAKLIPQRFALALSGTGTPYSTLSITLTGAISKDLPIVTIRRATVTVDANGVYAIQMGYGPDAHQRMLLTATAASAAGADAVAHIAVDGEPNGIPATGLDDWPKN